MFVVENNVFFMHYNFFKKRRIAVFRPAVNENDDVYGTLEKSDVNIKDN